MDCRACVDACPVACLTIAFNQDTAGLRVRLWLARARECIACRFCALEGLADAIAMKPLSQMSEQEN